MHKIFINANKLYDNSCILAKKVCDSGYWPDIILAVWRGGAPVGIVVHEYMKKRSQIEGKKNYNPYHTAIKVQSYKLFKPGNIKVNQKEISYILSLIKPKHKVLIVDDVWDTGRTIKTLLDIIKTKTKKIKVATVYYKPKSNTINTKPDYYVKEVEGWLVFPHELEGHTKNEIKKYKSAIVYNALFKSKAL